jgi:hypothetical protein
MHEIDVDAAVVAFVFRRSFAVIHSLASSDSLHRQDIHIPCA